MSETVLDDIWANEGGVSVRVVRDDKAELRIEFTKGVNERAEHTATLTGYRARRFWQAIAAAFPVASIPAEPEQADETWAHHRFVPTDMPDRCGWTDGAWSACKAPLDSRVHRTSPSPAEPEQAAEVAGLDVAEMATVLTSYAVEHHSEMGHSGVITDCCAAGCSEAAAVLREYARLAPARDDTSEGAS